MKTRPAIRTFRCGDAPKRGQGLRIGTTRRPPRGVPREHWQRDNYFDVRVSILAPSAPLLKLWRSGKMEFDRYCARYEREILSKADSRGVLELLAEVSLRTPISVGCYCADECRCHRSHLRKLIEQKAQEAMARRMAPPRKFSRTSNHNT